MSTLNIIVYALISSLIVSSVALCIFRLVFQRQQVVTGDDLDGQILRLISQSLASGWSPNVSIADRVTDLLSSPDRREIQPHQREILEWLFEIVKGQDVHQSPAADAVQDYVARLDAQMPENITLVSDRYHHAGSDAESFLTEYGSQDEVDNAEQVRELSTELQSSSDPDRRANAAIKLGQLGDPASVPYLVDALREDSTEQVQTFSAVALGMIGSRDAVNPLIEVIQKQIRRRIDVPDEITYGGFQLIRTLQREIDPEPEDWLGQDPIAAQIWALGRLGSPQACAALVERLADSDPGIRWFAAWALGKIGDERTTPALTALLEDPVDDVRWIAIWGLGRMNSTQALPKLIECAGHANPSIRRISVWALGRSGHFLARQTVLDALTDRERGVRQVASWALSQIEPEVRQSA